MSRDDRDLVRDAFARTRSLPAPDLTRRVGERIGVARRARALGADAWQPLLAGAALALVLMAGLLVEDGQLPWPVWGGAAHAPDASTLARTTPAPGGAAATILVAGDGVLRRVDWNGRALGTFVPPNGALAFTVSPDGALVAARSGGVGADILDAGGALVAHLPAFGAWSGDGAHVACALEAGAVRIANLVDPSRPRFSVTPLGGPGQPGPGWTLLGCSAGSDVMAAARQERAGAAGYALEEVDLVRLSTGSVLSHVAYSDGVPPVRPVLSHDGRLLAENDQDGRSAAIRDLLTGEVLGHVAGAVVAFTGDDRYVLTGAAQGIPRTALVDWRWGRAAWEAPGQGQPLGARPGGDQVAVALTTADGRQRTLLIGGDGGALGLTVSSAASVPA